MLSVRVTRLCGSGTQDGGAYKVLLDLITVFAPSNAASGTGLNYTLLYERDLDLSVNANQTLGDAARVDLPAAEIDAFTVARLVAGLVDV